MKRNKEFAAFILTHGRPNNVITYTTLRKHGYTGDIYIICDNEDSTLDEYIKIYGDKVIIFDKLEISRTFDQADNFEDRRSIVYARNASFSIAEKLGVKYFWQLDDDYTSFSYRVKQGNKLLHLKLDNLDEVLKRFIEYFKNTPKLHSIAFAQGGDFIGGVESCIVKSPIGKRKAMNSFICDVDRPFKFRGRINEDVNTYTQGASTGLLFLTVYNVMLNQKQTQSNAGGMTDIYKLNGTYVKSFYSVIFQPSSVKVSVINGTSNTRIHHRIKWRYTVPHILREEVKINGKGTL